MTELDVDRISSLLRRAVCDEPDWVRIGADLAQIITTGLHAAQAVYVLAAASAGMLRAEMIRVGIPPSEHGFFSMDSHDAVDAEGFPSSEAKFAQIVTALLNGDETMAVTLVDASFWNGDTMAEIVWAALEVSAGIVRSTDD